MFEQDLQDKFKKIFGVQRVSYDHPAPDTHDGQPQSEEQETIFIEIDETKTSFKDGKVYAHVTGKASMLAQNDKLPFGYFSKCIFEHSDDTKDLFFYQFEENQRLRNNLVHRGFSFIYFFNSQYDPNLGTLTSIDLDIEVDA